MSTLRYLEKHRTIPLILTLLLAVEIFYISSIPSFSQSSVKGINFAIIYHIMVFFLLTFFLIILIKGNSKLKPKQIIWVLIITVIYAIFDEIHQSFVPGRSSTIKDILIDCIGILLAILIYPKKEIKTKKEFKRKISKKSKLLQE